MLNNYHALKIVIFMINDCKVKIVKYILIFLFLSIGQLHILTAQTNNQNTIKVGVYENPPKIFINKRGNPEGIFIDVINYIAKKDNLKIEFVYGDWNQLITMLYNGQIDVLPDVAYSEERDSLFSINELSVLSSWLEVFTTRKIKINSILDLQNKKIGVLEGSVQEEYLNKKFKLDFELDYKIIAYNDYSGLVASLKNNEVDIIVATRFFYFSEFLDKEILPTGVIFQPSELYFAFPKNKNPELIQLFDKNISLLKNDSKSEYYKSLQRWLGKEYLGGIPNYIIWLLVILGSILLIVSIFALLLRYSVKVKTRDLRLKNEELVRAKESTEESEIQLQLIANNLRNGMIYQVFVDSENCKHFTYLSNTVEKFYGCTAEEAKTNANLIYDKIHKDDIQMLLSHEMEALNNMTVFQTVARVMNPDGTIRWSYFVSGPRVQKNHIIWDGLEIDITHQKQVEIELQSAKEKAEESDHLKSVFLQNMSHEIRTPMNGILGFLDLLQKPDLDDENKNMYIDIVNKSGHRLLKTINDIIEISKIESKQKNVRYSIVNIEEVMNFCTDFFKQQVEEKGIILKTSSKILGKDAIVETDKHMLESIFTNLINNALKFTNHGEIEFGNYLDGQYMVFYVKDTGIGLHAENLEVIFKRFVQANTNITRPHEGSGLGLSIVKAFIEMLNGKIWVESEIDKGSTFFVSLPYKPTKSDITKVVTNNGFNNLLKNDITILIAEDDEFSFTYIENILKNQPIKLLHANNGREAIKLLHENQNVSCILMDIKMPEMDGLEATQQIRQFNKSIPIIAQTAFALEGDKEKAINAGCNDYLTKPINKNELIQLIQKYTQ